VITIKEAEEILKKEYVRDNFICLLNDILFFDYKKDEHEITFANEIFDKVMQLGFSQNCDVTIFEVKLAEGSEKRRIAITQEMFRILRGLSINNALVAFSNANGRNYRISLLTSKYEFDGDKVVKVLSNPRRYSYSLGYGTKTKTAYQFLIAKSKVRSLDELINRFSVEIVNKQFYSEIALCYTELVGGIRDGKTYEKMLSLHGVVSQNKYAEFAVRLIGRIMFCWFLKEKKSAQGIPLVPDSMLSITSSTESKSHYHDVLEPLFFELLNSKRRKDKFGKEAIYRLIPYLNGGLFSPHTDDLYKYSTATQSGSYGLVNIPDVWFKHFYEVLGQYNFTVDENTSYDIELSIDPEMLGRIFENLLAEINPETGENAKKSTGSFYTPRDIVDYMVDSSLLEYLKEKTKIEESKLKALIKYGKEDDDLVTLSLQEKKSIINALYTITVLDPACGSGAFPIGMLQKIVYILQEIDPEANLWFDKATENVSILIKKEFEKKFNAGSLDYIRKLSVIQNSIFGVDIQPIAVEIARLRCFLSLVIEEKVDDDEDNRGINPLPNLDFKIICANSLISLGEADKDSMYENSDHISELKAVRDEYFSADNARRIELKYEFSQIQNKMYDYIYSLRLGKASERYQSLFQWKPFENEATSWFEPEWMFGIKDGFDILIANPPYLDSENMTNSGLGGLRDYISNKYRYCKGNWDIYIAFFEQSFNLLSNQGVLIFITPDKWISRPFGETLRRNLLNNILSIYQAGRKVFDSVLVDSIVTIIAKAKTKLLKIIKHNENKVIIENYVFKDNFKIVNNLDIIFSDHFNLITKIENDSFPLKELALCENACSTSDCYKLKEILTTLEYEDDFTDNYLKVINTGTIGRFISRWGTQEMKYLKDKYLFPVVNKKEFLKLFPNSYGQKAIQNKIIIKGLTLLDSCIDNKGEIIPGKSTMLISATGDLLYLLMGIINSKLIMFYINQKYASSSYNGGVNFTKDMINLLPLHFNEFIFNKIMSLSKIIVQKKQINFSFDSTSFENQIDQLVYQLYGLTEEEIAIVEASK